MPEKREQPTPRERVAQLIKCANKAATDLEKFNLAVRDMFEGRISSEYIFLEALSNRSIDVHDPDTKIEITEDTLTANFRSAMDALILARSYATGLAPCLACKQPDPAQLETDIRKTLKHAVDMTLKIRLNGLHACDPDKPELTVFDTSKADTIGEDLRTFAEILGFAAIAQDAPLSPKGPDVRDAEVWSRWIDGLDGVAKAMTGKRSSRWRNVESMFETEQIDDSLPGRMVRVRIDHLNRIEADRLKPEK